MQKLVKGLFKAHSSQFHWVSNYTPAETMVEQQQTGGTRFPILRALLIQPQQSVHSIIFFPSNSQSLLVGEVPPVNKTPVGNLGIAFWSNT